MHKCSKSQGRRNRSGNQNPRVLHDTHLFLLDRCRDGSPATTTAIRLFRSAARQSRIEVKWSGCDWQEDNEPIIGDKIQSCNTGLHGEANGDVVRRRRSRWEFGGHGNCRILQTDFAYPGIRLPDFGPSHGQIPSSSTVSRCQEWYPTDRIARMRFPVFRPPSQSDREWSVMNSSKTFWLQFGTKIIVWNVLQKLLFHCSANWAIKFSEVCRF